MVSGFFSRTMSALLANATRMLRIVLSTLRVIRQKV